MIIIFGDDALFNPCDVEPLTSWSRGFTLPLIAFFRDGPRGTCLASTLARLVRHILFVAMLVGPFSFFIFAFYGP